MSVDLEKQYEHIYRYCYFRLRNREKAEDITQETFLRFLGNISYRENGKSMQYLYTIARNLCIDEFRKHPKEPLLKEPIEEDAQEEMVQSLSLRQALLELEEEEREILLLRYVNEEPVSVICKIFGISRYALYRKTQKALKQLKEICREW